MIAIIMASMVAGVVIVAWLEDRMSRPHKPTVEEQAHHAWLKRLHESRHRREERGIS